MRESIRNEIVRLHYGGSLTAPHCKTAGDRPQECGSRAGGSRTTQDWCSGTAEPATAEPIGSLSPTTSHNCCSAFRT